MFKNYRCNAMSTIRVNYLDTVRKIIHTCIAFAQNSILESFVRMVRFYTFVVGVIFILCTGQFKKVRRIKPVALHFLALL